MPPVPSSKARRASGVPGRSMSIVPKMSIAAGAGPVSTESTRVAFNVGGVRYETFKTTLKNIPDTRLSWISETTSNNADYDPVSKEYFFDRHPGVFNMVLNYYRTGRLHCPTDVCGPLFEEELAFWGIDEKQIEPCCWSIYRTHRDAQETLAELDGKHDSDDSDDDDGYAAERFGIQEEGITRGSCWETVRPRLWNTLEEPKTSKLAQVTAIVSVAFILLSIATFCLESHVSFRVPRNESDPVSLNWTTQEKNRKSKPHQALQILDYVCIAVFTIEFILRLICVPHKGEFLKTPLNWVDLFSFVPFYIEELIVGVEPSWEYSTLIQVLKTVRLVRVFRIFKLARHFSGLKILVHSIKASGKELILLIMFLFISVLIFGCLIYYAEGAEENMDLKNDFKNIPIGFWWAVVTMTTLGYGDMYPRSALGYTVGVLCAISGVLVLALPVPVIVNNFALYYSHAQARMKLPKKKKRKMLIGAHAQLKQDVNAMEEGSRRSSDASGSQHSLDSVKKESEDSAVGSMDSDKQKVRTAAKAEPCGISVIFTDETGRDSPQSPTPSAPEPLPTETPSVNQQFTQNGGPPGAGKWNKSLANGMVYLTVDPPAPNLPTFGGQHNISNCNNCHSSPEGNSGTLKESVQPKSNRIHPSSSEKAIADVTPPESPETSRSPSHPSSCPTGRAILRRPSLRIA